MNPIKGIKYIRTCKGPKTKEQILQEFQKQNSSFPFITLPYEHIIHNITEYLQPNNLFLDPKEKIELSNYSIIIKNPLIAYQNLYFDSDSSKISNEIEFTKKFNCLLICDSTNKKYHQDKLILKQVQHISKINICFGQTLDYQKAILNLKKYSNDLQYLIVYGNDEEPENEKLIPAYIGEEFIDEEFDFSKEEYKDLCQLYIMIINDLVNKYGIPFYIKLQGKQKYKSSNTIINFFNNIKNINNKTKIVFILSLSDYEENFYKSEIHDLIEIILVNGYSLIISIYECDYSLLDKIKKNIEINKINLIDLYYNNTKALFINIILNEFKKYIKQIMISNNINYRIQLKEYGGFGYNNLFENYYETIIKGLNLDNINDIFCNNLLNLLCYWEPIERFKKSIKMVKCENCGIEKEENDKDLFSKFDKNFCSFKCLKEWLKKNPQ